MRRHDFFRRIGISLYRAAELLREARRELAMIDIKPSPDADELFEAFAQRFSVTEKKGGYDVPSPSAIRRIAKSGKGSRFELAFVLYNLFGLNGIEAECVFVYGDKNAVPIDIFQNDNVEHVLVYVPALDQHFDPTSRLSKELQEADAWLEERHRMYSRIPATVAWGYYARIGPYR